MHLSKAVAERIIDLCKAQSLSINKLSTLSVLRQSTLSNILNGNSKNPTIATIKKICDGFGMTLSDFFDDPIFDPTDERDNAI